MKPKTKRAIIGLAVGLCCALYPSGLTAQSGIEGRVGVGWDMYTRANSARADYQALRAFMRLSTAESGRFGSRFHLDARAKKGFDERVRDTDNPFADRGQIQRAYMEANGPGGSRLFIGRHPTPLRGIGSYAVDGLSLQRATKTWSARISGGFQAAFWKPNAPFDPDGQQWGGELEWHPATKPLQLQSAFLRDSDTQGRSRLRMGLGGAWKITRAMDSRARIEMDPQEGQLLFSRLQALYRPGRRTLIRLSYWQRLATSYPVFEDAAPLYGDRLHAFNLSAAWRRPGLVSGRLYMRYSFGARELRSQRLQVIWHRLPFTGLRLQVNARDSWSPWRRIEQGDLSVMGTGPKRLHFSLGVKQSFFKWNTSRQQQWRGRTRPHIQVRYAARAGWSTQIKLEETIDEFEHLRTRVAVNLSYRL
ncbi:MAG: hypothetical protein GKR89_14625 [Candidatus Latescibacteria bacterium]|nr:hypothetical protein [Candidatus Latescibacterota bacterium]